MSKIEEALEKANKLRTPAAFNKRVAGINKSKNIEAVKIDNNFIVALNQSDSQVAEEYKRLKSMVLRETKADFLNTIMVVSAVSGEGKTITAINLAVTMSQEIDNTILLVDADLRRPMIHDYLGIKFKYGLSDYLTRDIDISEVLVKTDIGNLVILPAGHEVNNPVELLSSVKMKNLIKELKQRYMDRYIIIDTPPIMSFAEGITLGAQVDGIVFVVMEGHAQKQSIEEALNMMKDFNILGVVYNNVSPAGINERYSLNYYYDKKRKEK